MFKKIFIGTLLVVFIGVLIFGAINRTQAKTGSNSRRAEYANQPGVNRQETGRSEREPENGLGEYGSPSEGRGQGQGGGQGQGRGTGRGGSGEPGVGQGEAVDWVSMDATVEAVATDLVSLRTADGQTIEVEGRPLQFIQEASFSLQVGDQLKVTGFSDPYSVLAIAGIENLTSGASLNIRDSSGRPMWAGRGGA